MRYDTVVFDLDGTLLATGVGIARSLAYAFAGEGIDASEIDLHSFVGPPIVVRLKELFPDWSADRAEGFIQTYRRHYKVDGILRYGRFEGLRELLAELKAAGKALCVATNKPESMARTILGHAGLDGFFTRIVGPDDSNRVDKKAECLELAIRGLPGRAVLVGDRESDVAGAKAVGVDSVYIGHGYGSMEEMRACKPTYYVRDVRELKRLLMLPGAFITFEGGEGAGKTTQIRLLTEHLLSRGLEVVTTREPGGCPLSEDMRRMLLNPENVGMSYEAEALLYAAARAQHVRQVVLPALEKGCVVLCDRYYDSSVAYQAYGRGLGLDMIEQINSAAMDGAMPQRTYLLYADISQTLKRKSGAPDRMERGEDGFWRRVAEGFLRVHENEPQRVILLDAGCSIEGTFDIIRSDAERMLGLEG